MHVWAAVAGIGQSDCEHVSGATLAQPVLAITSLAYVAAGVAVLSWALRGRGALALAAGVVLVAVGVGSFVYHGPQPSWAGPAHDWPIIALGAVCVAGLVRSVRNQWRLWVAAAGIFALALLSYVAGRSGSPWCRPDSLWQFHGVWHVLTAVAAGCVAAAMGRRREGASATHVGDPTTGQ
jgi:predicted membrane channel-forming protein YqfA (hemolysin III family)